MGEAMAEKPFVERIQTLNNEDLDLLELETQGAIDEIKSQLEEAKNDLYQTGQYREREWFDQANRALRKRGKWKLAIGLERRRRKQIAQSVHEEKNLIFLKKFLGIAKEQLDSTLFQFIYERAQEETS